jgi:hypothetical protein
MSLQFSAEEGQAHYPTPTSAVLAVFLETLIPLICPLGVDSLFQEESFSKNMPI